MIKTVTQNIFVSVPIRGLFNLTSVENPSDVIKVAIEVSVPIRGLFNLTKYYNRQLQNVSAGRVFPSPSGDYLI